MTSAGLAVSQMPTYSKGSRGSWVSPSHQPPPPSPSSCPSTPTSSVGQARPLDPAEAPDRPPTNACHSCPKGLAQDFSQAREKLWVWIPATGLTPEENEEEFISPRLLGVCQYTPDSWFDNLLSTERSGRQGLCFKGTVEGPAGQSHLQGWAGGYPGLAQQGGMWRWAQDTGQGRAWGLGLSLRGWGGQPRGWGEHHGLWAWALAMD